MLDELISLPLRVSLRAARLVLTPVARGLSLAGQAVEAVRGGGAPPRDDDRWSVREPAERGEPAAPPSRPAATEPPAAAEPRPEPPPAREPEPEPAPPAHVSEEPVLVSETADAGAEETPGAELHVDEPWEGYARMKAPDVVDRLSAASRE